MRIALAGAALLLSVTPAMAEDGDGISPKVAQCLRENAARVEAAEPDLTKATNYLIGGACAAPVADEQRRLNMLRNQQMAERNRNQCRDRVAAQKARERTTPPNYNPVYEDCELQYSNAIANQSPANPLEGAFLAGLLGGGSAHPPAVTSMAASLILDLRNARNKPRP
jgi:hypothetical protein